ILHDYPIGRRQNPTVVLVYHPLNWKSGLPSSEGARTLEAEVDDVPHDPSEIVIHPWREIDVRFRSHEVTMQYIRVGIVDVLLVVVVDVVLQFAQQHFLL